MQLRKKSLFSARGLDTADVDGIDPSAIAALTSRTHVASGGFGEEDDGFGGRYTLLDLLTLFA